MAFSTSNDINILQSSDTAVVGAGAGNDRYVLDASVLSAGQRITLSDTEGSNVLQLTGGLVITGALVSNSALQITLNNGAIITILGAPSFSFQTGGNPLNGTGGITQDFPTFVTASLGVAAGVPAGANVVTVSTPVTVNATGGTTAAGAITFALTSTADSVNEGVANFFTVTASAPVIVATNVTFQLATGTAQLADFAAGSFNAVTVTIPVGGTTASTSFNAITNDGTELTETYSVTATVAGVATPLSKTVSILDGGANDSQSFTLRPTQDTATANQFFASQTVFNIDGVGPTLNAGDRLTGTAGRTDNALTVTDLTAGATFNNIPAGVTLTNIQNIVLSSSGNTAAGTGFSTVGYADVRSLNGTTNGGSNDLYGAKNGTDGTKVTVAHNGFTGSTTVVGGTDVTATSLGGNIVVGNSAAAAVPLATQIATGAVVVNQQNTGAGAVNVFGGSTVNVTTSSTSNTGAINIGNTVANTGNNTAGVIANAAGNVTVSTKGTGAVTVFGGDAITITNTALAGAGNMIVGDSTFRDPSNLPKGNVVITETNSITYNGLAGSANNNVLNGGISVFGGKDVTITTNGANVISIGQVGTATKENALNPTGAVTVTNTGVETSAAAGNIQITGGTNVAVTTTGSNVNIGRIVNAATDQASNPSGNISVTQTSNGAGFARAIVADGGKDVTISAKGQNVTIGNSAASAPTGAVLVNQADIFTGNTNAILNSTSPGNVTVNGGTTVTVNTTGGNVSVGAVVAGVNTVPSGAVKITNNFGGVGNDAVTVRGGTTVDITTTKTSGNTSVGAASAALNAAGTALKDANLAPTGNVTIVNKTTSGTATAFGTGNVDVLANGATIVSVTGGNAATITDIQSTLATGGSNAGKAIGTSTLQSVVLDNQQGNNGVVINSDALTSLTVTNVKALSDTITINNNTAAHALTITQGGNTVTSATVSNTVTVVDAKAGNVTVKDNGTASTSTLQVDATKATAVTIDNSTAATVKLDGVASDIANVTFKGAGAATLVGVLGTGSLSKALTVDASAATGNVTASLQMSSTVDQVQSYKGGSAVDTITINSNASGWSSKATIDGGNGSADVLVANYAAAGTDVALGNAANVKGFEVLRLGSLASSVAGKYDSSGFSTVQTGNTAASVTFSNVGTGLTLDVRANTATADGDVFGIAVEGSNYSATNTALTVNLGSGTTNIIATGGGIKGTSAITANAVEALTVNSIGRTAAGVGNTVAIDGVASNGAATLTVGGTASLALTSKTGFTSINASGNTGTTVDVLAANVSNSDVTFTGGAAKLVAAGSNDSSTVKALVTINGTGNVIALGNTAVVNIGGSTFTYTATAGATATEIALDLAAAITAGATTGKTTLAGANPVVTATASGGNIVLQKAGAFEVLATVNQAAGVVLPVTTSIADSLLGGQQVNSVALGDGGDGMVAGEQFSVTINGTTFTTTAAAAPAGNQFLPAGGPTAAATQLAAQITAANVAGISSATASSGTILITSQVGQTNLVTTATPFVAPAGATNSTNVDTTSINMTTANNSFTTGAGGGDYKAGLGGSFDTVTKKFGSGSESVNLSASATKSDTLTLKQGAVVTDNGSKGGVTAFTVGSQAASDSMVFRNAADNGTQAKTIIANAVTGVVNTLNNAANMAAVFDSTGALNTKLANLTYSISNGVITFGATGGNSLSQFTVNELINAAHIIVSSSTTAGAGGNKVVAFSHLGKSYVVSSDNANTLATSTGAGSNTNNVVVELKDVASVKGFGSTFGDATIMSSTVTNLTNAAVDLAALATSSNLDYTGFAIATLNVAGTAAANTNTTKFANLAASAELLVSSTNGATPHLGLLETTQVGASGKNSLTVTASSGGNPATVNRLTVNGDALVQFKNSGPAFIVSELVDATNTVNTVAVGAGAGTTTVTKITGTALTTISTTGAGNGVFLGSADTSIAQNNLTFNLSTAQTATIFASGTGNTFTQGSATNVGIGAVALTASGASNTITLSNGDNVITANGAGAKITVGTGTNGITATGADNVITIGAGANTTTVTVGSNATVTVGTADIVKVNGAVSGGTASTFAKTTVNFAAGTTAAGNVIDFDDAAGVNFSLLGGTAALSQVNVASATSLAEALNLAANLTLLFQAQGTAASTANLAPNTAQITHFQYGGDTYLVAAVNNTGSPIQQTALDANDIVVKLTGLVDLTAAVFNVAGEFLTL